ncbi:MAG TPA: ATP-binding protein [Bacillota bacterium]|nr:ATP-binding protein [Bacillota bacterium]
MDTVPSPEMKRHFSLRISPGVAALLSLAGVYLLTLTPIYGIWTRHTYNMHLIMELACIFTSIGIFVVTWFTYGESAPYVNPICLGFIVVAVLDVFHVYYFTPISMNSGGFGELSHRVGFLARLTEAIILLLIVYFPRKNKINRAYMFMLALAVSLLLLTFISFIIHPVINLAVWSTILAIHVVTLVSVIFRRDTDSVILSTFLLTFLILSIVSIIIHMVFDPHDLAANLFTHMVRVLSSCFLFSAIIVAYIEQPLKRVGHTTYLSNMILNMLPEGVIHYDKEGRVSYMNKKAEEIFKIDKKELLEQSVEDFVDRFEPDYDDKNDFINLSTDNSDTNVLAPYKDSEGNSLKLFTRTKKVDKGTIVLLNEAKTHQRLKNIELQTKTILNSINNLVLIYDTKGKIVLSNRKFKEIMNFTDFDIQGMNIREFWRRMRSSHAVNVGDKKNISKGLKEIVVTNGDNKINLLYQKAAIKDISGHRVGTIIVGSDITEFREQGKIIVQQEKLSLLGQMGASIVHETRNYLTTIKGGSQLLELLAEDDRVKKIAERIDNATDDVNRIISGFLFLSRPNSSVYRETSVNELVESILPLLETTTFMTGTKISLTLCSNECRVLTDDSQIKQVIMNIAKNGVEAMGGIEEQLLQIETKFIEESNEMTITIEDKGTGVSKDSLKELGKPFFTTKDKGTGLGLSVSYRIIQEHGGRIDVDSTPGVGSKFIITLPCICKKP